MNLTIKKHNSLTDGLTNYSLTAEKLLNAVYHTLQDINKNNDDEYEITTFSVELADLKQIIGMNSDGNNEFLLEALKELQMPQSFRNFEFKGRGIKYFSGPLLTDLTVWKDTINHASLTINPKVIEALKIKAGYTPLELEIVNKFKTKHGYKLYQMWRRYYTLPDQLGFGKELGNIAKTMEDLNKYLNTNFTHRSKLKEAVDRGVREINKVIGEEVLFVSVNTENKSDTDFLFTWGRKDPTMENLQSFIRSMRKQFGGRTVHIISGYVVRNEPRTLGITTDGLIYDMNNPTVNFTKKESGEIWDKLYELALKNELISIKQKPLF